MEDMRLIIETVRLQSSSRFEDSHKAKQSAPITRPDLPEELARRNPDLLRQAGRLATQGRVTSEECDHHTPWPGPLGQIWVELTEPRRPSKESRPQG